MARPKLGEGETQRLHVMISEEELTAIDDWRFANRIGSRSEAVRRLVQMGLRTDERFTGIYEMMTIVSNHLAEWHVSFHDARMSMSDTDFIEYFTAEMIVFAENVRKLHTHMASLGFEVQALAYTPKLDRAIDAADHAKASLARWLKDETVFGTPAPSRKEDGSD